MFVFVVFAQVHFTLKRRDLGFLLKANVKAFV